MNKLTSIDRVFCLSDLHTDYALNLDWLENHCDLSSRDLLVVAGDISHIVDRLLETFATIKANTSCEIFFVPGNHEAWLSSDDGFESSFDKLDRVLNACRDCGVLVDATLVEGDEPLWVVPLHSWYDGTLSLENCQDLCQDFKNWPWMDFARCKWPGHEIMDGTNGRIPRGVADRFHDQNEPTIAMVKRANEQSTTSEVMTVSHFLPNPQSLPDWKDLSSRDFRRDEWLDHGAPGISAKFAKVAGSLRLDSQIRSVEASIHVFGHSHRPKDFVLDGVRYVHNPLGYGREREMYMVSPDVKAQLLWDTRTGQVPGQQVLRLWEEQGGGMEALTARLAARGSGKGARRRI
eukprot:CAMPEP_0116562732 /NCGR_PEP_ID=MMETSP0397-20121206/12332_1 /TAXON_ID=216820 /ORGANISM="Cyclophora tenuis, Strain ECT3854" /LENGTH=347 /DNA_ID=CAMNT_0004089079 /DNA_START=168 /DNA_END=1211 /DNA_ORIENTATION=+